MTLPCPQCERTIDIVTQDGDSVVCPHCNATSELHDDTATDLTTGENMTVRFLELVDR